MDRAPSLFTRRQSFSSAVQPPPGGGGQGSTGRLLLLQFMQRAPASSHSLAMAYAETTPVIDSAASAPVYSHASPAPVTTSADFYAAPAPAIDHVAPTPAVCSIAKNPVIESLASAPAVTDTTPVPVNEYVASGVSAPLAPVTVYASTSSNIAACAALDPVRDIIARYDARAAQNLKLDTCQATRAPAIEHVKTSPAGAYAGPKRKAKSKHDTQAVQDLIREAEKQAYA